MKREGPLRVLIVEDEALLAMDLEDMVLEAGHVVVGHAASLRETCAIPRDADPDLAFVDMHLAEGSSGLDVCRHIRAQWANAIVVFVTANPSKVPEDFAGAHGLIAKPFSLGGLLSAMRYIGEGVLDPPPTSPRPSSFVASRALAAIWG